MANISIYQDSEGNLHDIQHDTQMEYAKKSYAIENDIGIKRLEAIKAVYAMVGTKYVADPNIPNGYAALQKDPFPIAKGMSKFMLDSLEPGDVVELDNGDEVRLLQFSSRREFFEAEIEGRREMWHVNKIVGLISRASSYNEQPAVNAEPKCNCGGAKCQVPHSDWCYLLTGIP